MTKRKQNRSCEHLWTTLTPSSPPSWRQCRIHHDSWKFPTREFHSEESSFATGYQHVSTIICVVCIQKMVDTPHWFCEVPIERVKDGWLGGLQSSLTDLLCSCLILSLFAKRFSGIFPALNHRPLNKGAGTSQWFLMVSGYSNIWIGGVT